MSAFLFALWGDRVDPESQVARLRKAREQLSRRSHGGSAQSIWARSALLQCPPRFRGRELQERAYLARSEKLILAGNARLDDFDALATRLGYDARTCDDGTLVLRSYEIGADRGIENLLGDFSCAVLSDEGAFVSAFRDHFGVRPLYYYFKENSDHPFVVSSDLVALLALSGLDLSRDHDTVARFASHGFPEAGRTSYLYVKSVPPGSFLDLRDGAAHLRRYYHAPLHAPRVPALDEVEQLSRLLRRAVADRLISEPNAGALLSGGLDSSAIAGFAAPIVNTQPAGRLRTFSLVFPAVPAADEKAYISATVAALSLIPHYIDCGSVSLLADIDAFLARQTGPTLAPAATLARECRKAAAQAGLEALFDGHGGDDVISFGIENLVEHAHEGRWCQLWRDAGAARAHLGTTRVISFGRLWLQGSRTGRVIRRYRRRFIAAFQSRRASVRDGGEAPPQMQPEKATVKFGPFGERAETLKALPLAARLYVEKIFHPLQSSAFEVLDLEIAEFGLTPLYPFWDRRVVEFCLAMSPSLRLRNGWSRWILREILKGKVPNLIRWRRKKTDFGHALSHAIMGIDRERFLEVLGNERENLALYIESKEIDRLSSLLKRDRRRIGSADAIAIWRTAVLAKFLSKPASGSEG